MPIINDETIAEIDSEYEKWGEYLNGGIGILAFAFGLSCLGTPWPDVTGFCSLVFLMLLSFYGKQSFPQKIKSLRKIKLEGIDEMTLLGIEKKYFGIKALFFRFPIFLAGWCFLGGVSVYGVWY